MEIGRRLRELRQEKNLSQGDIEKRTGLFRSYISRVENGHTLPTVETLEKMARALEMPLYKLMYQGAEPPNPIKLELPSAGKLWGTTEEELPALNELRRNLARMDDAHRRLLLLLAAQMAHAAGRR